MDFPTAIRWVASVGVGAAISTGYPLGIAAAIAMPALAMRQNTRRSAYVSAFSYYAGASWPVIPATRNFFGPSASVVEGTAVWLIATVLLAVPWAFAWTERQDQLLWRAPLALLAAVLPPLGIIGWASPLTAAGFLFPGTAWFGLVAVALLCGGLCRKSSSFRTSAMAAALGMSVYATYPDDPQPPTGWEAFDTHFGAIAHGRPDPIRAYTAAQSIQERAMASRARVLVFPEAVVPRWTAATDLFWQPTLARLSASGKTILLGAGRPESPPLRNSARSLASYDFAGALAVLQSGRSPRAVQPGGQNSGSSASYKNAIVIRGAQNGTFVQRIPVPLGMWHPFRRGGVSLNLFGSRVIRIGGQRAAILICYEQLLTWPVLTSMLQHPTLIVAVANDYWVEGTSIPRYQANSVRAWSRLFQIPIVSAVNR